MSLLVKDGMPDIATALVRPTLENAITGEWLLDGGEANLLRFLGNDRNRLRQLTDAVGDELDFAAFDVLIDRWIGREIGSPGNFPKAHIRAGHRWQEIKDLYGRADPHVHVHFFGVDEAILSETKEHLADGYISDAAEDLMFKAGVVALRFGYRLHQHLGWAFTEHFEELFEAYGHSSEYGKDDEPL